MKNHILIFTLSLVTTISFAQENAKVFIARKGLFTTSGAINTFMDGKIICELNNKSYTVIEVTPGEHDFHAQWYGKNTKKDFAEEMKITIDIKAGNEYYLQLVKKDKGLMSYANVEEITASTWKKVKQDLKEDNCH
jgi:hypothetical protein